MPDIRYAHVGSTTYNLRDDRLDTTEDAGAKFMSRTSTHDGAATIEAIRGNTVVWNQVFPLKPNTSVVKTDYTITSDATGDIFTLTVTAANTSNESGNPSNIPAGILVAGHVYIFRSSADYDANPVHGYGVGIGTTPLIFTAADANYHNVRFYFTDMPVGTYTFGLWLIDLTLMLGAGNEPATVAEFEALYPEAYYAYDTGRLLSVDVEGMRSTAADSSWTQERAIAAATYFPTGMKSAGSVYDELTATKATTRIGSRAYASGDESDATVITDGTTTYYALTTPTETAISPALNMSYRVENGGTEEIMVDTSDPAPQTAPVPMDIAYGWLPALMGYVQS